MAEVPAASAEQPLASWLDRGLNLFVALVLFVMMALTAVDVIGRYALSRPVPGAFEISQFLLALMIFAALPVVTREQSHITIDILENLVRGPARRVQRFFVLLVSAVAIAIITWRMWRSGEILDAGKRVTGFLEWPIAPLAYAMSVFSAAAFVVVLGLMWRELKGGGRAPSHPAPDV